MRLKQLKIHKKVRALICVQVVEGYRTKFFTTFQNFKILRERERKCNKKFEIILMLDGVLHSRRLTIKKSSRTEKQFPG